ncbi:MAG: DNA recombination protein RmuC, partial [Bacteroidota bacterium]|nr:DNA recombination protein RmuC [Bacteroidota bacterium]
MDVITYLIIGVLAGGLFTYLLIRIFKLKADKRDQEQFSSLDKQVGILEDRVSFLGSEKETLQNKLEAADQKSLSLSTELTETRVENKNLQERFEEYKKEIESLQKKFTLEFENVASKILKQNTEEFTQKNQRNIGDILNPLKEKIELFEKKVSDTYEKGLKDQTDLKAELKKLYELNTRISEEANNLTRALKTDTKKQGNWGELILEKVLERSGLTKGQEYMTQYSD